MLVAGILFKMQSLDAFIVWIIHISRGWFAAERKRERAYTESVVWVLFWID